MGRNYYCEYCDKRMKNDVKVRKRHTSGLPHKMARAQQMASFRDPEEILKEERSKPSCTRFLNGDCKFGLFCIFRHYTRDQLIELEKLAEKTKQKKQQAENNLYDEAVKMLEKQPENNIELPFTYPLKKLKYNLPPSLQPISFEQLPPIVEWG